MSGCRSVIVPVLALPLESQGTNVNASTTRAMVSTGSMTRRNGFLYFLKSKPSRSGTTARFATPAAILPMFKSTTNVAPKTAIELAFTAIPNSRMMMNGTEAM